MNNYISTLRSKIGNEKIICPGARIIIENENKEFLVVVRADNGNIGLPAGSLEGNESIEECIIREVKEETGLHIRALEVIGISSNPDTETVTYHNGDIVQYFTVEFYSNNWEGTVNVNDNSEIKSAKFVDIAFANQLPKNEMSAFESLEYYRRANKIMLK